MASEQCSCEVRQRQRQQRNANDNDVDAVVVCSGGGGDLRDVTTVAQAEHAARVALRQCYFAALCALCVAQETLQRHRLCDGEERDTRARLACVMSADWVDSRRRQLVRLARHGDAHTHGERVDDVYRAYTEWQRQRCRQLFLFAQDERQDRMQIERQQRLHAGAIAALFASEYREAHVRQRLYERTRQRLDAATCGAITAQEVTQRTALLCQQRSRFDALRARETCEYLATMRSVLVNTNVEQGARLVCIDHGRTPRLREARLLF